MIYSDVVRDFALRTRRNLEAIDLLRDEGHSVFEVTQLINSMLGLLIFPQQKYVDKIPRTPLSELEADGWPVPKVRGPFEQAKDLNQFIRYLRNAVAHFNIKFVGDGKNNIAVLRAGHGKLPPKLQGVVTKLTSKLYGVLLPLFLYL